MSSPTCMQNNPADKRYNVQFRSLAKWCARKSQSSSVFRSTSPSRTPLLETVQNKVQLRIRPDLGIFVYQSWICLHWFKVTLLISLKQGLNNLVTFCGCKQGDECQTTCLHCTDRVYQKYIRQYHKFHFFSGAAAQHIECWTPNTWQWEPWMKPLTWCEYENSNNILVCRFQHSPMMLSYSCEQGTATRKALHIKPQFDVQINKKM